MIQRFKEGDAPVFLISLKAGGFGLNLTEADYCFLLDPWWNPAVEAQAIDRTHRIGQTRTVMVYRLIARDTIEDKVLALNARKAKLFASVSTTATRSAPRSPPTTSADCSPELCRGKSAYDAFRPDAQSLDTRRSRGRSSSAG